MMQICNRFKKRFVLTVVIRKKAEIIACRSIYILFILEFSAFTKEILGKMTRGISRGTFL